MTKICEAEKTLAGKPFVCIAQHADHRHYFVPKEDA